LFYRNASDRVKVPLLRIWHCT